MKPTRWIIVLIGLLASRPAPCPAQAPREMPLELRGSTNGGASQAVLLRASGTAQQLENLVHWLPPIFGRRMQAAEDALLFALDVGQAAPIQVSIDPQGGRLHIRGPGGASLAMMHLCEELMHNADSQRAWRVLSLPTQGLVHLQRNLQWSDATASHGPRRLPAVRPDGASEPRSRGPVALATFLQEQPPAVAPSQPPTSPTNQPATAAPSDPATSEQEKDAFQQLGDLKGVEIETLPEIDAIILRGRIQDVEELSRMIRELEAISREAQPEIKVRRLNHVSSEALQQILQTVQEDLVSGRQGRVTTTALVQPNALLLIGWGDALRSILELIEKLDQPASEPSQYAVFRLRYAAATQLQQLLATTFPSGVGLAPRVIVVADPRTNSVILRATPSDLDEARRIVAKLDVPRGTAVSRVQLFTLNNTLAADVAQTLQQLLASAGQGISPVLELLAIDGDTQERLRSAALSDVRVSPNVGNNTLLVTAPAESLQVIEQLIKMLDSPSASAQIKIFRVRHSDAANLVLTLRSLLPSGAGSSPIPSAADGETSMAPLRFAIDSRSNSIIAVGSEGDLTIVEALILRLDESTGVERRNEVYHLKNAPANDVAIAVNEFLRSQQRLLVQASGVSNPFEQLEREVVVVPEPVSNKLILSATPRFFAEIHELIERLDEAPPQVMIQVLIAEVALNNVSEFGVELGLQDSVLFDRSLLGDLLTTVNTVTTSTPAGVVTTTQEIIQAATNTPGYDFNNRPLGNSGSNKALANSDRFGGQGLSNFSVGRVNNELGFGGLVLSASSENVSILIRALQESRRINILSRPQVRTMDNQPAFIQVGQRVPRIIGSTISQVGQTNAVALEDVGLILGVTPRVSPDGTVVMEINAEKSSLGPEIEGVPISVSVDGTVIRSPIIETTTAEATVSAVSGETIVLGGLITKNHERFHRRVPWLSDLPVLGNLFQYRGQATRRTELLLILTPHVIRTQADSERLKQVEFARMSWCATDVFDIHGNIHGLQALGDPADGPDTETIYPDVTPRGSQQWSPVQRSPVPPLGEGQGDVRSADPPPRDNAPLEVRGDASQEIGTAGIRPSGVDG